MSLFAVITADKTISVQTINADVIAVGRHLLNKKEKLQEYGFFMSSSRHSSLRTKGGLSLLLKNVFYIMPIDIYLINTRNVGIHVGTSFFLVLIQLFISFFSYVCFKYV